MMRFAGMRGVAMLGVVLLAAGGVAAGQDAPAIPAPGDVRAFVATMVDELRAPGAAVAVVDGGRITVAEGFGRRDDSGDPVTARTSFQLASVSKSFAALVVLQLAAEGRLAIDDPVVTHVPAFGMADAEHAQAVTLRHLMNHTSGFSTVDGNSLQGIPGDDPRAGELAVRALRTSVPVAAPGEQFRYSNANYIVLGHLIETIEQRPFEVVLEDRVFSRLGMDDSYAFLPRNGNVAKGHGQWFGFARQNDRTAGTDGAGWTARGCCRATLAVGGVSASAEDLATYLLALIDRDPRVVPPVLADTWNDASFSGYAFGWHHLTIDGRRVILHDGLNPGFRARAMVLPDEGRAALLLMNMSGVLDGALHVSAPHHALGLPSVPARPSAGMQAAVWGTLVGVLSFVWGCTRVLGKAFRLRHSPWNRAEALRWLLVVAPSLALAGGAYALLVFVPRSLALNFSGTQVFFPDLAAMLLVMAITAVIWALVLPVLVLKRPRASA